MPDDSPRPAGRIFVSVAISVLCVLLASAIAMGPARHLGATSDEGAHIAAGLQWWNQHRFTYEPLTPPLARIVVSFLPWLWGFHAQGMPDIWSEGHAVLAASGDPALLLLLARMGTLLFLVWSSVNVWLMGRRTGGPAVAAVSVLCFCTLPPIIGNAGIATTDLAQAATFTSLIYVFMRFVEAPLPALAALLGLTAALAFTAKFTSIAFLPVCVVGLLVWRRLVAGRDGTWWPGRVAVKRMFGISLPVTLLAVWAIYNFRTGSLLWQSAGPVIATGNDNGRGLLHAFASLNIFPANEFWRGLVDAFHRNRGSFPDYFFGRIHEGGTVLFVPVSFLLKTPIHFLLLTVTGVIFSVTNMRRTQNWNEGAPWIAGLCVIVAAVLSVPHLGTRYVLSAYVFFSPTAGSAAVSIWNYGRKAIIARVAVGAAALWAGFIVVDARREYLGWFNGIAGSDPTWFVSGYDTDTDYGQYGVFLAEALRRLGVSEVKLMLSWDPDIPGSYNGVNHDMAELMRVGMPRFTRLAPDMPATGWIAITADSLRSPHYHWLEKYPPVAKVFYEINIYHLE